MKILYISPENTVGLLPIWKKAHEERGNTCEIITLYQSKQFSDNGICLNLPMINTGLIYRTARHLYYKMFRNHQGDYRELSGFPPTWSPAGIIDRTYINIREKIWKKSIEQAIVKYNLMDYDIYHLEWGLEFYRNGSFIKQLKKHNKKIVCSYHGQDMRTRGVIEPIDKLSDLNITSEFDLLPKHPNIKHLPLPFNVDNVKKRENNSNQIVICHAPTNRYYKGSKKIISICQQIESENKNIKFILIENKSHNEVMKIKSQCDIHIDQIGDRGGWGFGMSSLEAMSMGLCCMTQMDKCAPYMKDHPFIDVNEKNIKAEIELTIQNPDLIQQKKGESLKWVKENHSYNKVIDRLYDLYQESGII